MGKYRCKNCGYTGEEFIFQFTDYSYCVASNEGEPKYLNKSPEWVKEKAVGEAKIGEPVGCPKCHSWGIDKFEIAKAACVQK